MITISAATNSLSYLTFACCSYFSVPNRLQVNPVPLTAPETLKAEDGERPWKRLRLEHNGDASPPTSGLMSQVEELAGVFTATLDL